MARLTLILTILTTVVALLGGFRYLMDMIHDMRTRKRQTGRWLLLLLCAVILPVEAAWSSATLPTLPQANVDVSMPTVTGTTYTVSSCGTLQSTINTAAAATSSLTHAVDVQAGLTCTGPITLPSRVGATGWVLIRTANYASIPTAGTRVSPSDTTNMPQIKYGEGTYFGAIVAMSGATRYRLIGLSIVQDDAITENAVLVETGQGNNGQTNTGYIILDRMVIRDTTSNHPTKRNVWADADNGNIAIIESHITGAKSNNTDAQNILAIKNPGPILIRNNYLEGGAENVNFCGGSPGSEAAMPQDITITRNLFTKPAAWLPDQAPYISKTFLEFKCGLRALVEGNIMEDLDVGTDNGGYAMRLTVRAEGSGTPWMEVSDLTIRYNTIRRTPNGFLTFASDDHGSSADSWSMHSKRWYIHNNLIYDLAYYGSLTGKFWLISYGSSLSGQCTDPPCGFEDITFRHNTLGSGIDVALWCNMGQNNSRADWLDNLIVLGTSPGFGIVADCNNGQSPYGTTLLNSYWTDWTWTYNTIIESNTANTAYGTGSLPAGNNNVYPTSSSGYFTNEAADDYTIPVTSPAYHTASDGHDRGVDFTALAAAQSGTGGEAVSSSSIILFIEWASVIFGALWHGRRFLEATWLTVRTMPSLTVQLIKRATYACALMAARSAQLLLWQMSHNSSYRRLR